MSEKKKSSYLPEKYFYDDSMDGFGLFFGLGVVAAIVFAVILVFFVYKG